LDCVSRLQRKGLSRQPTERDRMIDRVDIRASIEKRRVIYQEGFLTKAIDCFVYAALVLPPGFFASLFFLDNVRNAELTLMSWLALSGGIFVSLWILRNTLRISRLSEYVIRGNCRARVKSLVARRGWVKLTDNKRIFVAALPMSGFSWGEQLTVIYAEDKILVNTVSFGLHRIRSPFHVSKCQRISDRFAEELNAEPAAT
jgi:hypothetical protein